MTLNIITDRKKLMAYKTLYRDYYIERSSNEAFLEEEVKMHFEPSEYNELFIPFLELSSKEQLDILTMNESIPCFHLDVDEVSDGLKCNICGKHLKT